MCLCPFGQQTDCNVCLSVISKTGIYGTGVMSPNDGLQEAFRKFKLSADIKKSSGVSADSTFAQVIAILQTEVKSKCLANKANQ